ncbi:MAG: hypothetical protein Q8Q09_16835 [Deltaproteobacteria bacterium]|nr:hypothetical protein [Deltaproteobacteria bacterium]
MGLLLMLSVWTSGCECTLPAVRQADGTWVGPNCLAPSGPKCCGSTVCRATGMLPTSPGVCLAQNACLPRGYFCSGVNPDGSPVACCTGLVCDPVAGCVEACSARPEVGPGERCCGTDGQPTGPVCMRPLGGTCACPVVSTPCAPAGTQPNPAINQQCCAPAINVSGSCCIPPGEPAMLASQCCMGVPFNATTGRCNACISAGQTPGPGQLCCDGLSLVGGVCQAPCVAGGMCTVNVCEGVNVQGTFGSCDVAEPVCIRDPAAVVCTNQDAPMTPLRCGRTGEMANCNSDNDCAPAYVCDRMRLNGGNGFCVDWAGGPNQASTTCWLPSDRGRLICRDGTRLTCPPTVEARLCPRCP